MLYFTSYNADLAVGAATLDKRKRRLHCFTPSSVKGKGVAASRTS